MCSPRKMLCKHEANAQENNHAEVQSIDGKCYILQSTLNFYIRVHMLHTEKHLKSQALNQTFSFLMLSKFKISMFQRKPKLCIGRIS